MRRAMGGGLLAAALMALGPSAGANVWPSSHERVARALRSTDLGERRSAAAKLLELPPEIARPLVLAALDDPDQEVKLFAARAAVELRMQGLAVRVASWLSDPDSRLRVAACNLIEPEPSGEVIAALGRAMADVVPDVRRAAAAALGAADSADAVAPLLGRLDDSVVLVRLEVVRALERLGDPRAVLPLVSKLQDGDADVRAAAARSLGALGDPKAIPTLMLALEDGVELVREQALAALGALRAEGAINAIAALLVSDPGLGERSRADDETRRAALDALSRIGSPAALQLLLTELERETSPSADRRIDRVGPAQRALAMGGPRAQALLLETLRTTASSALATGAALVLARQQVRAAGPLVLRAARRGTIALSVAVAALGALGDPTVLPELLEHLDAADPALRRSVIEVASSLLDPAHPDGRVVDPVRPRLMDPRTPLGERVALVRLLGRSGAARAQDLLRGLSFADVPAMHLAIVEALGELRLPSPQVDAILLEALAASSPRLRMAAAQALGQVGRDATAQALLDRLENAAEQDRGAIGLALAGVLANAQSADSVQRTVRAVAVAPEPVRDALVEGLGRCALAEAGSALAALGRSAAPEDRRKVAEALAGHPAQAETLFRLSEDGDPSVRANAAWSLGQVEHTPALARLVALLGDLDVTVAANAARSIGRLAGSGQGAESGRAALCRALDDPRSYVRVNALVSLRWMGGDCGSDRVRRALQSDGSWRVRRAAADRLWAAAVRTTQDGPVSSGSDAPGASKLRRSLARCAAEDRDSAVADRCATAPSWPADADPVLVFVVPLGASSPQPHAPFALELADGSLRLGTADRRGAVFERAAAEGPLRLAEPGPLVP